VHHIVDRGVEVDLTAQLVGSLAEDGEAISAAFSTRFGRVNR